MDWSLARDKAAAVAAQAGANTEESETPGSGAEAESEPAPTLGCIVGGTREEASLGVSGSSGAEWIRAEDLSHRTGIKQDNVVPKYSTKGQSLEVNLAYALGWNPTT